ncbi:MAG: hypothetical protein ACHQF0_05545 [Chitinophagales bacterium]
MKQLSLIFIGLVFLFGLVSCGGNAQGNAIKDSAPVTSAGSSADGDASFSCKLDGVKFSASGTDQNINSAFRLTGSNKGKISFKLSDKNDQGVYASENYLMFRVPGKEGSTTFTVTGNDDQYGYVFKRDINYNDNPLTVTIISISPTRVSGTFAGTYTLAVSGYDAKQTIQVTDGKFDIPFSTSAIWKQANGAE